MGKRSKCKTWDELNKKPCRDGCTPCMHGMCGNKDCKVLVHIKHPYEPAEESKCKTGKTWCELDKKPGAQCTPQCTPCQHGMCGNKDCKVLPAKHEYEPAEGTGSGFCGCCPR